MTAAEMKAKCLEICAEARATAGTVADYIADAIAAIPVEANPRDAGIVEMALRRVAATSANAVTCWLEQTADEIAAALAANEPKDPRDVQIAALREALGGMLHEWDKLTRYGSPLAKAANENLRRARAALAASEPKETK